MKVRDVGRNLVALYPFRVKCTKKFGNVSVLRVTGVHKNATITLHL